MGLKVVVIGAGQAAAAFAARLVDLVPDAAITIVGDEPSAPYQRPPLSKKYMTGEMSADRLLLRPLEWYADHRIAMRTGVRAEAIRPAEAVVRLADGEELAYDRLLIATGASPRRLPAAIGGDLAGVYTLRTLADADAMAHEFHPGRRALIVGGGYIGLEAAAVAATLGLDVHLAEMAPRILQRVAAPQTSDYFRALHAGHGVKVLENVRLARLVGQSGRVARAEFADGVALDIDFVLVGIGIAPNTALAEAAGLAIDNGIAVDLSCRTSDERIHAAGDCASFEFGGRRIRLESVQNAIDQAEAAAAAIAGQAVEYRPVPWFWSDQYDVKLQIAGLNLGHDNVVVRPGARPGAQSVWYHRGEEFLAVDAMNDPRSYMFGKRLLEAGRNVTPAQAADPAFDLKTLL
ncbi:MAG: pyridine nucleotide-disulfide oxidoreductase [Alphaproteobacteria bacterium]|nr:MAG: pyridine nucleotide-disulfide oxidoreductase [Alphaproteobacteria bacterium]